MASIFHKEKFWKTNSSKLKKKKNKTKNYTKNYFEKKICKEPEKYNKLLKNLFFTIEKKNCMQKKINKPTKKSYQKKSEERMEELKKKS